ncbi:MAG: nucleoside hydrolase [Clostridia bacterium]|nr:nucleoside hydrolase [Clostridia bacterium]
MKKIIFDTDIGSDIDDALALAYLLNEPECDLLGITTVSGCPVERAKLVSAICRSVGRYDIPIYPGMEGPFIGKQWQPKVPQAEKLCNWEHEKEYPMYEAVEFMRRTIRENPGEITLLAVGPMTNVATLFAIDPEIPLLLEGLVLMCGMFDETVTKPEWNAKCDWVATAGIYSKNIKLHRSYGLNVTLQLTFSADEVKEKFTGSVMRSVRDFSDTWFQKATKMIFHDPLAAMAVFHPEVCTYKRGNVKVDVSNPDTLGRTLFEERNDGMHEIAVTVDKDKFFELYLNTVNK